MKHSFRINKRNKLQSWILGKPKINKFDSYKNAFFFSVRFLVPVVTLLLSLIQVQLTPISSGTQIQIQNQTFTIPNQSQAEPPIVQPDNTDVKTCNNVIYYPIKKIHFEKVTNWILYFWHTF